jgi:hypothetical protein
MARALKRRTVLRGILTGGAVVTLSLPRLAAMLDGNGLALASGAPLPRRFGTWFFGNGILPAHWIPTATGAGSAWTLSPALAPLLDVKPWLSVVTGLEIKLPNIAAHKSMPAAALTGGQSAKDVMLPSIDQLLAPVLGKGTLFPTGIHVGLSNISGAGGLDLRVSFSGPNASNPPEYSPAALFKKLLQLSGTTQMMATAIDPSIARRKRVLDAVADDAKALRLRLGKDDQDRLDRHLEGVSELETQIMQVSTPKACGVPVDPDVAYPNRGADGSITRKRGQAFSDLLVFAMACDLSRIFTYMFSCAACHAPYVDAGLDNATFHEDYGHRKSPKGQAYATDGFKAGVVYAMSNLADTLGRMKSTPDGAGNLLDNSCVYVTSCVGESVAHGNTDYPVLVAGKAGGALKGDQHLRTKSESVSKVPFTLLTMMGSPATSFGKDQGLVTTGLGDLLT